MAFRAARYRAHAGKELIFGLRPEHITEPRSDAGQGCVEFKAKLDVVEPMGNETMVFYTLNGVEVCARINPSAASGPGEVIGLMANMNHMHLIDKETDLVL